MAIEDQMLEEEAARRGMSSTQLKMLKAVPDALMRDIAQDARRSMAPSSTIPARAEPAQRGNGWIDPKPLTVPSGVAICDRLVDAQDALDRRQRERERNGL